MGFYGNQFLIKENNTIENISEFISYSYNELCNYNSLLESCTDDKEREILEAKVEVLYEISMKDIGIFIRKAINRIIEIIRDAWNRIKEFFKSKKSKMMEEEIKDLKKKVNDLEKDKVDIETMYKEKVFNLKNENDNYKSKISGMEQDIKNKDNQHDKTVKDYQNRVDTWRDRSKTWEDQNSENQNERIKLGKKISSILAQLSQNKFIYFNMYDYIVKDFDPVRFINSSEFQHMFELKYDDNGNSIFRMDDIKENKYINIINDDMYKKMEKYQGNTNVSNGGYNHYAINRVIEQDLEEKMNKSKYNDINELIDHLEWLCSGYQITACNRLCNGYNILANRLHNSLGKYTKFDTSLDPHESKSQDGINKKSMDEYSFIIKTSQEILRIISNNAQYLSVFCRFAGKASGSAEQALMTYKLATAEE